MDDEEKIILETFGRIIPKLSDLQRARLLGIGQGIEIKIESDERRPA